jgi:cation diffusion facilitator family transporter
MNRANPVAWWALAVSLAVLTLKLAAFAWTGSVALLSDAAESLVNVTGALSVVLAVRLAARPPDYEHPYGHAKAEYLSSALEGALVLASAVWIVATSLPRLIEPEPIERTTLGLVLLLLATMINVAASGVFARAGRQLHSSALAAHARHLRTDVWTSLGVAVGVILASVTGVFRLDAVVALVVAVGVAREGVSLMKHAASSLMDVRLSENEESTVMARFDSHPDVLGFHRLRTRQAGHVRFVEADVFVDPALSVRAAHDLVSQVERSISDDLGGAQVTLHAEPFEAGVRDTTSRPKDEFDR